MHTDISASDKRKLFPSCGQFYPNVQTELANCTDFDRLRQTLDKYRSTSKVASRLAGSSPEIYDKVDEFFCIHFDVEFLCRCYVKKSAISVSVFLRNVRHMQSLWRTLTYVNSRFATSCGSPSVLYNSKDQE